MEEKRTNTMCASEYITHVFTCCFILASFDKISFPFRVNLVRLAFVFEKELTRNRLIVLASGMQ